MLFIALTFCFLIVSFAAVHALVAMWFLRQTTRQNGKNKSVDAYQPTAAVVLTIRGCDPTLKDTVLGLINQKYGDFRIHLVIDHRTDAAWNLVKHIVAEFDLENRCVIHEMLHPRSSCGLKCGSLVQAIDAIDKSTEVVCTIDADICPHPEWLSELVAPLRDGEIGVVTGNHWFAPDDNSAGSLIRSIWNAGAIVPTSFFANPWAGTCAMRLADIEESNLVDIWKKSIVDDGPIRDAIRPLKKKILFLPSLIMINREKCTMKYLFKYLARMLTWSRIYERTFIFTVMHLCINGGALLGALTVLIMSLIAGETDAAIIMGAGLVCHNLFLLAGYLIVRAGVAASASGRGVSLPHMTLMRATRIAILIPVTFGIYGWATIKALTARRVQWREITYRIEGRSGVEMLKYQPLTAVREAVHSEVSI